MLARSLVRRVQRELRMLSTLILPFLFLVIFKNSFFIIGAQHSISLQTKEQMAQDYWISRVLFNANALANDAHNDMWSFKL